MLGSLIVQLPAEHNNAQPGGLETRQNIKLDIPMQHKYIHRAQTPQPRCVFQAKIAAALSTNLNAMLFGMWRWAAMSCLLSIWALPPSGISSFK
jgi:hypothetical protein